MKSTLNKLRNLIFIIFSIIIIASCGKSPEEKIIGVWFYEALDKEGYSFQVEFKEVGVGNYKMEKDGEKDDWNMTYIISGTTGGYPSGTYSLQVPYENQNFELKGNFKMVDDNSMIFGIQGREAGEINEVVLKRK
jgi:hypothetical protein